MKSRTSTAMAALAAVASLALTACSAPADSTGATTSTDPTQTSAGATARGELLTLGILQEPASWDPAQAHVGHRLQPFQAAYDTLILREPDGAYAPMLATEWGYTDETNLVFSLDLRTDVTFSDGAAFDAAAVVANIEHFKADNGPQAGQAAAIAGEVDATLLDATTYQQAQGAGFELLEYGTDWQGLLLFDRAGDLNPALADVRVRQAINFAFDLDALLEQLGGGFGETTSQAFGPDSTAFLPELEDYYSYDPDKARELLADAGYADGLTIELPVATPGAETIMTFATQQLADIGITVQQTSVPVAVPDPDRQSVRREERRRHARETAAA